jgi:hypothetical protein
MTSNSLPPGYVLQEAADGTLFAVPQFLTAAVQSDFDAQNMKDIYLTTSEVNFIYLVIVIANDIFSCASPCHSTLPIP